MNEESSLRQNPDEFHGLGAEKTDENLRRGHDAARRNPEEGQTGPATVGHGNHSPNYGTFGQPESTGTTTPQGVQVGYEQQTQPPLDDTHHGDDRFRHSGTRNWATDEPANPHQYKDGEWSDQ